MKIGEYSIVSSDWDSDSSDSSDSSSEELDYSFLNLQMGPAYMPPEIYQLLYGVNEEWLHQRWMQEEMRTYIKLHIDTQVPSFEAVPRKVPPVKLVSSSSSSGSSSLPRMITSTARWGAFKDIILFIQKQCAKIIIILNDIGIFLHGTLEGGFAVGQEALFKQFRGKVLFFNKYLINVFDILEHLKTHHLNLPLTEDEKKDTLGYFQALANRLDSILTDYQGIHSVIASANLVPISDLFDSLKAYATREGLPYGTSSFASIREMQEQIGEFATKYPHLLP